MNRWREQVQRGIYVVLTLIAIADVSLLAYVIAAKHSAETSQLIFRGQLYKYASPPTNGYSAAGLKVAFQSRPTKGWAVRYASPGCTHCRADQPQWDKLKSQLLEKGYQIYVIPPDAKGAYAEGSAEVSNSTQISYVNVELIKQYRLTGTPTTLLFDSSGKMIWGRIGEISQDDAKSAMMTVRW